MKIMRSKNRLRLLIFYREWDVTGIFECMLELRFNEEINKFVMNLYQKKEKRTKKEIMETPMNLAKDSVLEKETVPNSKSNVASLPVVLYGVMATSICLSWQFESPLFFFCP